MQTKFSVDRAISPVICNRSVNLRAVLLAYRMRFNIAQGVMAKRLGLSAMDLSRFEAGRELSSRKLAKIVYWLLISDH